MKKTLLTAFFLSAAASAVAAPLNTEGTFTGAAVEVGAGVSKSDVKNSSLKEKNKADVSVRGNYNTQFGASNWIGGRFEGGGRSRTNMNGLGYGVGAKYAVTPNVEVGAEWEQTRYKKDNLKIHNNSYMATVGYRFK